MFVMMAITTTLLFFRIKKDGPSLESEQSVYDKELNKG